MVVQHVECQDDADWIKLWRQTEGVSEEVLG